jgi:MFS family permease
MANGLPTDDLNAAVEAGVIDAAQAEKLRAMRVQAAPVLGPDGEPALADEERFRFLNGFNDVFLTIGVLLVAGAFLAATSTSFFGLGWAATLAVGAAVFWVLSEILVSRLRAVLPGIVLSLLIVVFAASAVVVQLHWDNLKTSNWDMASELAFWRNPTLVFGLPAMIASLVYYLRFRLPFALALIACFGYAVVAKSLYEIGVSFSLTAIGYGLIVLAVALFYDARDPRRVTRLSDCAFWLHLVAAPLIVSPVIMLIKHSTNGSATSAIVLMTVIALAIFALAIDRRALLVSSLASFTVAVYDILSGGIRLPDSGGMPISFILTLALVGGFVLILGVFWHPLRNRLLPILQATALGPYLPQARP